MKLKSNILTFIFSIVLSVNFCEAYFYDPKDTLSLNKAGVYVQLSQGGLDYIASIAQSLIPELIRNYTIPDTETDGTKLSGLDIEEFTAPNITASFKKDIGIEAFISLPNALITGQFESGFAFWSKTGRFRARVTNLELRMVATYKYNETLGHADIQVPVCTGKTEEVLVVFGGGWSSLLNALRLFLAEYLTQQLDIILCDLSMSATQLLSEAVGKQQQTMELDESLADFDEPPEISSSMLCSAADLGTSKTDDQNKEWEKKFSNFGILFELIDDPKFTDTHAVVPFNGGMTYRTMEAVQVHRAVLPNMPYGQRMGTFVITEYVLNTFFSHVKANGLGQIMVSLRTRDLPKLLRKAVEYFCFGCELRMLAGLLDAPTVTVTAANGVSLYAQGNVRLIFDGPFKQFDIVAATTGLTITVKPYVRSGTLYGKVDLDTVNLKVDQVGVTGVVGSTVGKAMRFLVPRKLWPQVKRKLVFALDRKGFKLPVVCGLELKNTILDYVDHAVVIDTDLQYDVHSFVNQFIAEK